MASSTITVRDIASKAGVSIGTVSRVLNNAPNISPENLKRVKAAAAELGYTYDETTSAASRRSGVKTKTIATIMPEFGAGWSDHPLLTAYLSAVDKVCQDRGFHNIVTSEITEDHIPRCVMEKRVDGLIIKGVIDWVPECIKQCIRQIPIVGLSMYMPSLPISQVMPDNRAAGMAVTRHLWDRGHRRIGFVCTNPTHRMFIPRFQGYEEALRLERAFDPHLVQMQELLAGTHSPELSLPDLSSIAEYYLAMPQSKRPTAIIAANDWMAVAMNSALMRRGIRVPDDLSLIGLDNMVPTCCAMTPALTSYAIPFARVGQIAANILLDQIEDPSRRELHSIQLVSGEIVERDSVATVQS